MLLFGTLVGAFGVRGEAKLVLISTRPDHLAKIKQIYVGDELKPYAVTRFHEHKQNVYIVRLKGIETREDADALRSLEVFIPREKAAPLDEDEYFIHDLMGLNVRTSAGEELGRVVEVLETGANDVLVVRSLGRADILVPMVREIITKLDVAGKLVEITSLDAVTPE